MPKAMGTARKTPGPVLYRNSSVVEEWADNVLRIVMVGIDLQSMALDNGAQQIEARILIPSAAFVEIDEGKEGHNSKQKCGFAAGR